MAPSRPITRYDQSIEPQHVHLLQYVYSDKFVESNGYEPFKFLFRYMAFFYTPSIEHVGLRHSILAYAAHHLGTGASALHLQYAIQALGQKLTDPRNVDEGDLFVSCLLARCGSFAEEDREQMIFANLNGFVAIMKHLFMMVEGDIDRYPLAVLWPLARDELGSIEAEFDYPDLRFWDASCQILGLPTFQQTNAYLEALSYGKIDEIPVDAIFPTFQITRLQNEAMRAFIKLETKRQQLEGFSPNTLPTSIPIKQLQDDHAPPSSYYQEAVAGLSSTLKITSIPLECMSAAENAKIRSETLTIIRMFQVVLVREFNRLLRTLLEAPSIVEGLISSDGIDAGRCIASHICTLGGTMFLNGRSCQVVYASDEIGVCLQFWKYLVPKANMKFLDSSMEPSSLLLTY